MKTAVAITLLSSIVNAYVSPLSSRRSHRLNYKTHEEEYGVADNRVRSLMNDDRVSVLKLLETEVVVQKKRSKQNRRRDEAYPIEVPKRKSSPSNTQPLAENIWSDVDADRFSPLASLLEPPVGPFVREEITKTAPTIAPQQVRSRMTTKSSTITPLASIADYNQHILSSNDSGLKLIRFSAPWCQVCRTTNVAFDRMASKLSKSGDVQFYSVLIDSNKPEDAKNLLKDSLEVQAVPTGVLYHPSVGVIGRVNLNRGNMGDLKKRLDGYVNGALHRQGEMMWMEALVMGLEVGEKRA